MGNTGPKVKFLDPGPPNINDFKLDFDDSKKGGLHIEGSDISHRNVSRNRKDSEMIVSDSDDGEDGGDKGG